MSLSSFNPNAPPFTSSFPSFFSPFTPIPSPDLTTKKISTSRPGSQTKSRSSHSHSHSHSQSQNITPMPDLDESQTSSTPSTDSPPIPTPGTNPRAAPWTGISGSTIAARLSSQSQHGQNISNSIDYARTGSDAAQDRSDRARSYTWQSSGGLSMGTSMGLGTSVAPPNRSNTFIPSSRSALGDLNLNLNTEASLTTPSLGLASPFVPADPNGVWGPPPPLPAVPARQTSVEERLAQAEEKIRRLTLENEQLRGTSPPSPYNETSTLSSYSNSNHIYNITSSPLLPVSSSFADSVTRPGYVGYAPPRMRLEDLDSYASQSAYSDERSDPSIDSVPSPALVASVLQGAFDYSQMHHAYIRPIVWVVAHRQPRNNSESAGLKTAVNALATRLTLPRDSEPVIVLIDAILEWAKALCFTSCGNYLCQQLLEKGEADDKRRFIQEIKDDLVIIASDKFGTHVLCKAVAVKELEDAIADALVQHGIFESFKTGARRLWREYLEKCRQSRNFDIFVKINDEMEGKWVDLACANEHGSIAVQQVFEVFGSPELMEPCFRELLSEVSRVANNQFGHFVLTKLIGYPPLYRPTCDAILGAYPPVATSHHGVNFAKIALTEGGRASIVKYIEAICNTEDGRTPGIVAIATSSIGKTHLTFVLGCLTPSEHVRVRQVCRAFSTTLRNSQSGNDLLRSLGLINAPGSRHRMGP